MWVVGPLGPSWGRQRGDARVVDARVAWVEVGDHWRVNADALLRCEAVSWVLPDEFPPVVEVVMTDARGRQWRFHDKAPVFDSSGALTPEARLPLPVFIRVRVVDEGDEMTVVTDPDAVESVDGNSAFIVSAAQLERIVAT
jgi:hypothetical protein